MKIKRFEDIIAWEKGRELNKKIYQISAKPGFSKDWALKDQIRRASMSIMSNIAEGFDSGFKNEFVRFLCLSRRSASEVQSHLYVALDQGYIDQVEFQFLYNQTEEVRKIINGFRNYLKSACR